jgi:hypothetical protein
LRKATASALGFPGITCHSAAVDKVDESALTQPTKPTCFVKKLSRTIICERVNVVAPINGYQKPCLFRTAIPIYADLPASARVCANE